MGLLKNIPTFNGKTLFNLTYGTKAVIPIELGLPSYKVQAYDKHQNPKDPKANLNFLEEVWEKAHIRMVHTNDKQLATSIPELRSSSTLET